MQTFSYSILYQTFVRALSFASAAFLLISFPAIASAQTSSPSPASSEPSTLSSNQSSQGLNSVTVVGQLNEARDQIVPDLGATKYSIGQTQIQTMAQGDNAPFNQVILRI